MYLRLFEGIKTISRDTVVYPQLIVKFLRFSPTSSQIAQIKKYTNIFFFMMHRFPVMSEIPTQKNPKKMSKVKLRFHVFESI